MPKKILFVKSLPKQLKSTEELAIEALNNPEYDKFPQYIDKNEIQRAFDEYGYKLNPFNSAIYTNVLNAPNIEGHFLAANIPEIDSMVLDGSFKGEDISKILDKNDDITHIGISAYAHGLDNVVDLIEVLKRDYPDKIIYIGGVGSVYSYIQKLVESQNICTGNGIPWLRRKFNLSKLERGDYQLPVIIKDTTILPVRMKTLYLVSQIGCPFNCDFCITSNIIQYNPFTTAKKIIRYIEDVREHASRDMFLYLCEPNACFPERVWKEVFNYFMTNRKRNDINFHIVCLISLAHLQKFDLKKIQERSAVKFFFVNFGIESTLQGGYKKNQGVTNEFIKSISDMGIISNHNFILGLPFHTEKSIDLEIKRNLEFDSCWYFISTLKPLPMTKTYQQLKNEGLLFKDDLPPEFVFREGFFPFKHKNLGGGFSALKYAFKAYYETEKKVIDVYSVFAETLSKSPLAERTSSMNKIIKSIETISRMNYTLFEPRMPTDLIKEYQIK
jgi:radical SAM superfamily enzyme YgiQ (UPF0313 family)